jgi:hypothetical protein
MRSRFQLSLVSPSDWPGLDNKTVQRDLVRSGLIRSCQRAFDSICDMEDGSGERIEQNRVGRAKQELHRAECLAYITALAPN